MLFRLNPCHTLRLISMLGSVARERVLLRDGGYRRDRCKRWLSEWKWPKKRVASSDQRPNCYKPLLPHQVKQRRLEFAILN